MEKIAIIGASRGLGREFTELLNGNSPKKLLLVARKDIPSQLGEIFPCDLSLSSEQSRLCEFLINWQPKRLFYFAGGGPYGPFVQKNWRDHNWCWQVSFVAAARILHAMAAPSRQLVFIGSQIAEASPDMNAASYAAAKHALKGLITSVQEESPELDLRLYSPGYMDTGLIPPGAHVRKVETLANPHDVAADLWRWCCDEVTGLRHRSYPESNCHF